MSPYFPFALGPVSPSYPALSGRLELTIRRHKLNKKSRAFAQVMGLAQTQPLHVMKDAMLAFSPGSSKP